MDPESTEDAMSLGGSESRLALLAKTCNLSCVMTKKAAASQTGRKTSGMRLVEKYRARMSRLTDAERQKLMARGLQIVYGNAPAAKSTHRG